MTLKDLIGRDPNGRAAVRNDSDWVPVVDVLRKMAAGQNPAEVRRELNITFADVLACIGYGADAVERGT